MFRFLQDPLHTINKWSFPALIRLAWDASFSEGNIRSGFAACGIFMWNAITDQALALSCLSYNPVYSPHSLEQSSDSVVTRDPPLFGSGDTLDQLTTAPELTGASNDRSRHSLFLLLNLLIMFPVKIMYLMLSWTLP